MEDVQPITASRILEDIRKTTKKYRYELILLGTGAFVGYFANKRKWNKREDLIIETINDHLRSAFAQHDGNFRTEGGGYVVPVWHIK